MEHILEHVVFMAKPSLTEFRVVKSAKMFEAFATHRQYTIGFQPSYIGDVELHIATIMISDSDDEGFDIVVRKKRVTKKINLTVPNSGRVEGECWVLDWRLDEAASELAQCLKDDDNKIAL